MIQAKQELLQALGRALAQLAEQRQDMDTATQAYRQALKEAAKT